MSRTYISTADTAKLIRQTLKTEFPGINFGVRSKVYSGGSSITIRWVDGPTEADVHPYIDMFAGATFDGMQDLKEYRDIVNEDGERVHYGVDFVFCNRDYSESFTMRIMEKVCAYWNIKALEMNKFGWFDCPAEGKDLLGHDDLVDLIRHARNVIRENMLPQNERIPSWIQSMIEEPASVEPQPEAGVAPIETDPLRERLSTIDLNNITPMQALAILAELKAAA